MSVVIGPPDLPCLLLSLRVRSGDISSHVSPSSRVRSRTCEAWYRTVGSCGDTMIGAFHWKRYFRSFVAWPSASCGQDMISRVSFVRLSYRVICPPYSPPKTTSGFFGDGAIQPLSPPPTECQSEQSMTDPDTPEGMPTLELSCCEP